MQKYTLRLRRILAILLALTVVFTFTLPVIAEDAGEQMAEPTEPAKPDRPDRPGGERYGKPPKPTRPDRPGGETATNTDAATTTITTTTTTAAATTAASETTIVQGETTTAQGETATAAETTTGAVPPVSEGEVPPALPQDPNGTPPAMPDGETPAALIAPAPAAPAEKPDSYKAAFEFKESDKTIKSGSYVSLKTDESAILLSGGTTEMHNIRVTRASGDSTGGDTASFYGVGAAILATGGTGYIQNADVKTNSAGGAGVFAYDGANVYVADSEIETKQDTSGALHVAGGGTLYAYNVKGTTYGASSAAIRSDRGGGKLVADGGTFTSNGTGSPAVYSTADIAVHGAALTATQSEAVCVEGRNSLSLYDCTLSGNMPADERNECTWTVIVYQSMSGDAEEGKGSFRMNGGTLESKNGGVFYTTNTQSSFVLQGVDIRADSADYLLRCTGNTNARGWGQSGSNGAKCTFTAIDQQLPGNVVWDSASELTLLLTGSSVLTGAILQDDSCAGSAKGGHADVTVGEGARWIVTENSTLSALHCAGSVVDANGRQVTIVGTDGKVYAAGDSTLRVTVSSYDKAADLSGADSIPAWSAYAQTRSARLDAVAAVTTAAAAEKSRSFPLIAAGAAAAAVLVVIVILLALRARKKRGAAAEAEPQDDDEAVPDDETEPEPDDAAVEEEEDDAGED